MHLNVDGDACLLIAGIHDNKSQSYNNAYAMALECRKYFLKLLANKIFDVFIYSLNLAMYLSLNYRFCQQV